MMKSLTLPLMTNLAGVSAFSTLAGFNFDDLHSLASEVVFPVQTHTANVRIAEPGADLQDVDGLVCTRPGVLIGVRTADCLPLLMADIDAGVIAAVHCGWRGTVAGIALNALSLMIEAGAAPGRIHAAMGPCICPDCFEVGPEVADLFPPSTVHSPQSGVHSFVDLAAAVSLQLRSAGVSDITLPPACSKTSPQLYSVRRQGRTLLPRTLTTIMLCR